MWFAVGRGSVWVTAQKRLARIDLATNDVTLTNLPPADWGPIAVTAGIAYGEGRLWVTSTDGVVTSIDPQTARVVGVVRVGGTPQGVAFGYGRVWVAVS